MSSSLLTFTQTHSGQQKTDRALDRSLKLRFKSPSVFLQNSQKHYISEPIQILTEVTMLIILVWSGLNKRKLCWDMGIQIEVTWAFIFPRKPNLNIVAKNMNHLRQTESSSSLDWERKEAALSTSSNSFRKAETEGLWTSQQISLKLI